MILNDCYVPGGYLNDVDDPGTSVLFPKGEVGRIIYLDTAQALRLSKTATGTLYEGFYQFVKFKSGSSASNALGQLVFWDSQSAYQVTPDIADATALGKVAGVTLNAVTKGNYGWIQISGRATVKCSGTVTDTTNGDLAIVDQTPANTVNSLADATTVTGKIAKSIIGSFNEAPANAGSKQVLLRGLFRNEHR